MADGARQYVVTVGEDAPRLVTLRFDDTVGGWTIDVDGRRMEVRLDEVDGDGRVRAHVDGRPLELARRRETPEGMTLGPIGAGALMAERDVRVRPAGEVVLRTQRGPGAEHAPESVVRAPTAGVVLAVHAREGQAVRAGEPLVTLEAMKMESTLRSPRDGVVHGIRAGRGEAVRAETTLVEVGDASAPDASDARLH